MNKRNLIQDYINGKQDISEYNARYKELFQDWIDNQNKESLWQTYPIWINALKTYMSKYLKGCRSMQFFNERAEEGALYVINKELKNPSKKPIALLAYARMLAKNLLWGNFSHKYWDYADMEDDYDEIVEGETEEMETTDVETMRKDLKNMCNFMRAMIKDLFSDESRESIPKEDTGSIETFDNYKKGCNDILKFMNKLYEASVGAI